MKVCSVNGCEKKHYIRGYCCMHHRRIQKHGSLESPYEPSNRFKKKYILDPETNCWPWTGYVNNKGYGGLRIGNKSILAHRFSWELSNGSIPKGVCVLHKCDNPLCVNPDHLFLGTLSDNMMDCLLKGRSPWAKLIGEDVIAIRASRKQGVPVRELSDKYNVNVSTIRRICNNQNWKMPTQALAKALEELK